MPRFANLQESVGYGPVHLEREERHKNVSVVPILYNHLGHSISQEDKKCVRKRTLVHRTLK